ncbi:hypothetical protein B0H14DRAFT_3538989 [Mycena olivaceomarginata]|nr:hypothetical protein B0H14DRAFT_3538989 [Mycena olivaceomarginata]
MLLNQSIILSFKVAPGSNGPPPFNSIGGILDGLSGLPRLKHQAVLSTVPDAALSESGILFPVIAVLLGRDWELGHREFDTADEAEEHARDVVHALRYSIALFGLVTASTLQLGPTRHPNTDAIVHWLKRLVFNTDVVRRADAACTLLKIELAILGIYL